MAIFITVLVLVVVVVVVIARRQGAAEQGQERARQVQAAERRIHEIGERTRSAIIAEARRRQEQDKL